MTDKNTNEVIKYVDEALKVLMNGRTFFEGYFDIPFERMSRTDQATYLLLKAKGVK